MERTSGQIAGPRNGQLLEPASCTQVPRCEGDPGGFFGLLERSAQRQVAPAQTHCPAACAAEGQVAGAAADALAEAETPSSDTFEGELLRHHLWPSAPHVAAPASPSPKGSANGAHALEKGRPARNEGVPPGPIPSPWCPPEPLALASLAWLFPTDAPAATVADEPAPADDAPTQPPLPDRGSRADAVGGGAGLVGVARALRASGDALPSIGWDAAGDSAVAPPPALLAAVAPTAPRAAVAEGMEDACQSEAHGQVRSAGHRAGESRPDAQAEEGMDRVRDARGWQGSRVDRVDNDRQGAEGRAVPPGSGLPSSLTGQSARTSTGEGARAPDGTASVVGAPKGAESTNTTREAADAAGGDGAGGDAGSRHGRAEASSAVGEREVPKARGAAGGLVAAVADDLGDAAVDGEGDATMARRGEGPVLMEAALTASPGQRPAAATMDWRRDATALTPRDGRPFDAVVAEAIREASATKLEARVEVQDLGSMRIRAERTPAGIEVSLLCDNLESARWAEGQRAALVTALHAGGVSVGSLRVGVSEDRGTGLAQRRTREFREGGSRTVRAAEGSRGVERRGRAGRLDVTA